MIYLSIFLKLYREKMDKIPIVILGTGGHSKVLIDCLRENNNITILDAVNQDQEDEIFKKYAPSSIKLVNGVGSTGSVLTRKAIFEKFKSAGYKFLNVIH